MKIVFAIDSFKGSMSSLQAGYAAAEGAKRVFPDAQLVVRPLADGGEGTVEALAAGMGGYLRTVTVDGPLGEPVSCAYGIIEESGTAVIEMAAASGLTLVPPALRDPMNTSTYGVGQVIADAIAQGCRRFIVGIGGSATNDGGAGMLQALGFALVDAEGNAIPRGAKGLKDLAAIDESNVLPQLKECTFRVACDVTNPLCGEKGASAIFGPQKGADEAMVERLDAGLRSLAAVMLRQSGREIAAIPGAGAAGAFGAGIVAFTGGHLKSGIETVLDCVQFDELLRDTDMVFTGEGKLDSQSLRGKVVIGIARRAAAQHVPVTAIVGSVGEGAEGAYDLGVTSVFSINRRAEDFSVSRHKTKENFTATMDAIVRLLAR